MIVSPFIDLKNAEIEEVYPLYEEVEEDMDNQALLDYVAENMPPFAQLGQELSLSAMKEIGHKIAGNGVALGFFVTAAVVWKRLEELSLNPATEAGIRAQRAQQVLQNADAEELARMTAHLWLDLQEDARNSEVKDANESPTLQVVAEEYEGLILLVEYICDDRVERGNDAETTKYIRGGGVAFVAIMRQLEIASEIDSLLQEN